MDAIVALPRYVLAEFATTEAMLAAGRKVREQGYTNLDSYSPYPVHGVEEALGFKKTPIAFIVLAAALTGTAFGFGLIWFCNVYDFPINVANRPPMSLPLFVPVCFETTILFAAFGAFFGSLGLAGMPQPYHFTFEHERFRSASIDRFWLSIPLAAPEKESELTETLRAAGATDVAVVEDRQ